MAPLFGGKDETKQDKNEPWRESLRAECDRLNSLTLSKLAAEVMSAAFAPGRPGADEEGNFSVGTEGGGTLHRGPSAYRIAELLLSDQQIDFPYGPMRDRGVQEPIVRLVAEALQQLEHTSVLRAQLHDDRIDYALTRRGRGALERAEVEDIVAAHIT